MKLHFGYLLGLASLLLAGCAAFFSVYGISQLFAGASTAVIVMASSLEFSKLVAASYLQRYWSKISKGLRIYVASGVIILVLVTSAGIYGFLSSAYQQTANDYAGLQGKLNILQGKEDAFTSKLESNNNIITNKNNRSVQLSNLRNQQEVRMDSLIANNNWVNARKTREDIDKASEEIQKLTNDVDGLNSQNGVLNDSINKYKTQKIEEENSSSTVAELGPLKYLSGLTGLSMDRVVNFFILILIFVFDPLAIALILATNWVFKDEAEKNRKDIKTPTVEDIEIANIIEEKKDVMKINPLKQLTTFFSKKSAQADPIEPIIEVTPVEPIVEPIVEVIPVEPIVEENAPPLGTNVGVTKLTPTGLKKEDIKEIREGKARNFSQRIPTRRGY